ncbi:MAG: hypothetical protein A4E69_00215 [Syntrophus sp. PtaB.Bin138]|nr:MAG: hypothetical protein A4E69_00215 [Syntrophus sp. PtaB.Bin138]
MFPVLLTCRINPQKPIDQTFQGVHQRVQKRLSRRIENAKEVKSHRFGQSQQQTEEEGQLQPAVKIHDAFPFLKLLRPDDRNDKVSDQEESDYSH